MRVASQATTSAAFERGAGQRHAPPGPLEGDRRPGHLGNGRHREQHDHHAIARVRSRRGGVDQPRPRRRQGGDPQHAGGRRGAGNSSVGHGRSLTPARDVQMRET